MSEAICPMCNEAWKVTKKGKEKKGPLKVISISDPSERVGAYIRKHGCADCTVFGHTVDEKNAVTVARFLKDQAATQRAQSC